MAIDFACPHCGLETLVDDDYAGQSGPCASCGKAITVPYTETGSGQVIDPHRGKTTASSIVMLILGGGAAAVIVLALLVAILFPAFRAARAVAHSRRCESNLERIAMALQQYESEHGTLPPAYVPDKDGTPMHSWRVLILPQLGEQGLYDRYDFSQPWDSPQNRALHSLMPEVYGCPSDPDSRMLGESNYHVIVGPETAFPGEIPTRTADIWDPIDTTLLIVETPITGSSWMAPEDLTYDSMQFMINGMLGKEIGSMHDNGAYVLTADGTVQFLRDATPSDYIQAMTSTNGNEPIPSEVFD